MSQVDQKTGKRQIRLGRATGHGQATVEFALVLIVLMAVLYGIIEISRLLLINAEIQNAAREGAHYAALHPEANNILCIQKYVIDPKLVLVDRDNTGLSKLAVFTSFSPTNLPGANDAFYYPVKVSVSYQWNSLVNFMPDMSTMTLKPWNLTLQATSSALIENPKDGSCSGN